MIKNYKLLILLSAMQLTIFSCDKTEKTTIKSEEKVVTAEHKEEGHDEHKEAEEHKEGVVEVHADDLKELNLSIHNVSKRQIKSYLKTSGEIGEDESLTTHVTSKLSGRVISITKSTGDYISKGEILANIESHELAKLESDLLEIKGKIFYLNKNIISKNQLLKASLLQQDKYVDFLKQTYERQQKLFAEDIAPRKNVEEADKNFKTSLLERDKIKIEAENQTQQIKGEIDNFNLQSESIIKQLNLLNVSDEKINKIITTRKLDTFIPIYSPTSGLVSKRHISSGELISPDKEIFTIIDPSSVWLYANLYEKDMSKVKLGQNAYFVPRGYSKDSEFKAKVDYILPQINEQTRTARVRLKITNKPINIKTGTFADIFIDIGENNSVIAIPKESIQRVENKDIVYLKKSDTEYQTTEITKGISQDNFIEITNGLKSGDKVVSKGSFTLKALAMKGEMGHHDH